MLFYFIENLALELLVFPPVDPSMLVQPPDVLCQMVYLIFWQEKKAKQNTRPQKKQDYCLHLTA